MIRISYEAVRWGVDQLEDGAQLNLLDEHSGTFVHIPFGSETLINVISDLIEKGLNDEQKRSLSPKITGGLVLPGNEFNPPKDIGLGPQG